MNSRLWIAIPLCLVAVLLAGAIAMGTWYFVKAPTVEISPVSTGESLDLGLVLPGGATEMKIQQVLIDVRADERISIEGEAIETGELETVLAKTLSDARESGAELTVALRVEGETRIGYYTGILDTLTRLDIENVSLIQTD